MEFALPVNFVNLFMWASYSRVFLKQTPRYGVEKTFSSVLPSRLRVYWAGNILFSIS